MNNTVGLSESQSLNPPLAVDESLSDQALLLALRSPIGPVGLRESFP